MRAIHVNDTSRESVAAFLLFAGVGALLGFSVLLLGPKATIPLCAAPVYFFLLFRMPHVMMVVGLLVITELLDFVDYRAYYFREGLPTLSDLIFVSLFLPAILLKKWRHRIRLIYSDLRYLFLPVLAIILISGIQILRTSIQYDFALGKCIKAGMHYWYYAFLPLAAVYLDTPQKQRVTLRWFLALTSALGIVLIIQTVVLTMGGGLFLAESILVQPRQWGSFTLYRIYLSPEPMLVLGFAVVCWAFLIKTSVRDRVIYGALSVLLGLAVLLINSRMRWFHALLAVIIPLFLKRTHIGTHSRFTVLVIAVLLISMLLLSLLVIAEKNPVEGVLSKAYSAWSDFSGKKGTWGERLEDSEFRVKLIKQNPFFGVGLVPFYYAPKFGAWGLADDKDKPFSQGVSTPDLGLVALMIDFGIVGVLWAAWYFAAVILFCKRMLVALPDLNTNWLVIPLIGYMSGGLMVFVTLGLFTWGGDIMGYSFLLGILAAGWKTHHTGGSEI
jgi:hypothetical protein